jgi:hypothetical protein
MHMASEGEYREQDGDWDGPNLSGWFDPIKMDGSREGSLCCGLNAMLRNGCRVLGPFSMEAEEGRGIRHWMQLGRGHAGIVVHQPSPHKWLSVTSVSTVKFRGYVVAV